MQRKSGIEFDYSDMVSKLPKDTFETFFFEHQSDFLNPDNRIQFPENDAFNSRLVSAIMKSTQSAMPISRMKPLLDLLSICPT